MGAGQFLRAMVVQDKTELERRALSEASDSAGGYTVPDVLSATLIDKARAASVVMQAGAQTVPLTSDKNTIAKVLTDPVPAWRAEAGSLANNDGTFGAIVLTPQSLAISVDISAELMADSLNLATALPDILAAAMAVELDRVALIGTGTAPQPRGVANTTGIGTFAQDALIANYANLSKARTGILTANRGPVTGYIMHPRDEGSFVDLADSTGQPLMGPKAVSDIPMFTTTSLPIDGGAANDESTIIAGNFARLLVGIRSGIQVELFKGPKYISNLQYTMVAHMRADIAVEDPAAFYTITGVGQA
jgi:HK97 family phage major capsid protein